MKFAGDHRVGPETARLTLRALEPGDAAEFYRLNSDPDVMRYTGEPPCGSVAEAEAATRAYPERERYGIGRWETFDKATGELIGFAGLRFLDDMRAVDLGYRFLPAYWGRGLATEAGEACLEHGVDVLGLERVIARVLPENGASEARRKQLHDPPRSPPGPSEPGDHGGIR